MSKEEENTKPSFSDRLKERLSKTATKAGQGAQDAATVLRYMNTCDNLKPYFSVSEYFTYKALIIALLEKRIDPDTVTFGGTTDKNRTILLSYNHIITETGKIKSVPGTLAFYKASGDLVDLYKISIDNEAFEIKAFEKERAKDAEARKRRSRGIVASWGK